MHDDDRLHRVLGPVALTALGVGVMIGAGIFVMRCRTGDWKSSERLPALVLGPQGGTRTWKVSRGFYITKDTRDMKVQMTCATVPSYSSRPSWWSSTGKRLSVGGERSMIKRRATTRSPRLPPCRQAHANKPMQGSGEVGRIHNGKSSSPPKIVGVIVILARLNSQRWLSTGRSQCELLN